MAQIIEKPKKPVFMVEIKEIKQKPKKKEDKSSGISNPRYFEHAKTPKKAKNSRPLKARDNFLLTNFKY
jgi:hypothetical protein